MHTVYKIEAMPGKENKTSENTLGPTLGYFNKGGTEKIE